MQTTYQIPVKLQLLYQGFKFIYNAEKGTDSQAR